jgi:hypothetical protein
MTKERMLELVRMEDALLKKMRDDWAREEEEWQRAEHLRKIEEACAKIQYFAW